MSTTQLPHDEDPIRAPLASLAALFWFFVTAMLAFTASLLVLAGSRIVGSTAVSVTLGVMLVLFVAHTLQQFRHRRELHDDPRLRHARERRGF